MKRTIVKATVLFLSVLTLLTSCQQHTDASPSDTTSKTDNNADTKASLRSEFLKKADEVTVTENSVIFTDALGETREITKLPETTVSLYTSLTTLWYESGGTVSGCIGGKAASELYVEYIGHDILIDDGVTAVSTASNSRRWDVESIVALKPSLILVSTAMGGYETIRSPAESAGIPVVAVNYNDFTDYLKWFKVFCNLNGRPELWEDVALSILDDVTEIIYNAFPEKLPQVLCLFSGTDTLEANTENTVVGKMLAQFNTVNIADPKGSLTAERIDINLEIVFAADPDIILVQCHTDTDTAEALVNSIYGNNPVWTSLRAVKEGKVFYLEKELFHNKPNRRFAEAYETLAKILYGNTQKPNERIVSFSFLSSHEALPYKPESAIVSGAAVGGNPRCYVFDRGLTFFRQEWFYDTVAEFSISLPEGYSDGNILFIGSGAGSGEIHMMLEAVYNGETRYIVCDFFTDFLLEDENNIVLMYDGFITAEDAKLYFNEWSDGTEQIKATADDLGLTDYIPLIKSVDLTRAYPCAQEDIQDKTDELILNYHRFSTILYSENYSYDNGNLLTAYAAQNSETLTYYQICYLLDSEHDILYEYVLEVGDLEALRKADFSNAIRDYFSDIDLGENHFYQE